MRGEGGWRGGGGGGGEGSDLAQVVGSVCVAGCEDHQISTVVESPKYA